VKIEIQLLKTDENYVLC